MTHGLSVGHMAVPVLGGLILVTLIGSWTSRLNTTFFFGRTVDALQRSSEEARATTRRYIVGCWFALGPGLALVLFGWRFGSKALLLLAVICTAILQQVVFARAHREARVLSDGENSTGHVVEVLLGDRTTQSGWIPKTAAILAPVAAAFLVVLLALYLAGHGEARSFLDHWTALLHGWDVTGSTSLLGFGTAFVLVGTGVLLSFRTSVRLRTKMAQYTLRVALALSWMGAAVISVVCYCAVEQKSMPPAGAHGVTAACLVLALATQVWNQWRSKELVPAAAEMSGDEQWRWGLYYRNPGDPALFVQRRTGIGFTLNYGRGWAWVISAGVVAYFVSMIALNCRL